MTIRERLEDKESLDRCYGIARSIVKDSCIAPDIAHQVIVMLLESKDKYTGIETDPEFYRLFYNKCRNEARKLARRREFPTDFSDYDSDTVDDTLDDTEACMTVDAAIGKLPGHLRAVCRFRMRGYTVKEIAARLDKGTGTIDRWLKQARQRVEFLLYA